MLETKKHLTARRAALAFCALAVLAAGSARAAGEYARSYNLHTLDYRVAENLVWELCREEADAAADCRVQNASRDNISIFAGKEIHARVVRMLAERDRRLPSSLLFEIVLVRLAENGDGGKGTTPSGHVRKAIDAVLEIFPDRTPEVVDTGLIRAVREGRTRLGNESAGYYNAALAIRNSSSGEDGLEFTVDLEISQGQGDQFVRHLGSTLTIQEGETVVAGSSRMGDRTSIVVLLTSMEDE